MYFAHRSDAFRALGRLMVAAHNAPFGAKPGAQAALAAGMQFEETPWLELTGVQLDCSRGGVPHVAALQDWAVQLALYGFNALLLYMVGVRPRERLRGSRARAGCVVSAWASGCLPSVSTWASACVSYLLRGREGGGEESAR